jgi:hypothetical protein
MELSSAALPENRALLRKVDTKCPGWPSKGRVAVDAERRRLDALSQFDWISLPPDVHFKPVLLNMPDAAPPTLATVCGHEEDI